MIYKKIQQRVILICAVIVTALAGFGCYRPAPPVVEVKTRAFTDDIGRKVQLPENIDRIISLAPNLTEIIFAVNGEDKLVGVTTFCNYPLAAKAIRKVSDTQTPNIETIVALRPQVVFVSTASQLEAFTKVLTEQKITVFVTSPNSLDGIYKSIAVIGQILGTSVETDSLIEKLQGRVADVRDKTIGPDRPKVFVQIDKNSLYTIGRDSYMTDIIAQAGGRSATADVPTGYPNISRETALAMNPDVIIISESEGNREPNEVFRNSPAVQKGRVYRIDADLLSRPGPRIVDALEQIAGHLARF